MVSRNFGYKPFKNGWFLEIMGTIPLKMDGFQKLWLQSLYKWMVSRNYGYNPFKNGWFLEIVATIPS